MARLVGKVRSPRCRGGFSIIESLVAMWIITIGLLALAMTMNTALATNRRTGERERALELAQQQLDRIRSLPYNQVGLGDPTFDLARDPAQGATDWYSTYCPISTCDDTSAGGRIITLANIGPTPANPYTSYSNMLASDPRRAKTVEIGANGQTANSIYFSNGIVLYTYVYWNDAVKQQWKVITVVARYADPPSTLTGSQAVAYSSVRVTGIVVDNPGLGQVPSS